MSGEAFFFKKIRAFVKIMCDADIISFICSTLKTMEKVLTNTRYNELVRVHLYLSHYSNVTIFL